jgi:hypothetical protein
MTAAANDLRTRVIASIGIVNGYQWAHPVTFQNVGVTLHNRFGAHALEAGRVSMAVRGPFHAGLEVLGCRYRVIDQADLGAGQQIRQIRTVDLEYPGAVVEIEIARSDEFHWTIVGAAGVGVAVQSWDIRVESNGVKIAGDSGAKGAPGGTLSLFGLRRITRAVSVVVGGGTVLSGGFKGVDVGGERGDALDLRLLHGSLGIAYEF